MSNERFMNFTKEILKDELNDGYYAARNERITNAMRNVLLHARLTNASKVDADVSVDIISILAPNEKEVCAKILSAMRVENFTYADAMQWVEFMKTDFLSELFI